MTDNELKADWLEQVKARDDGDKGIVATLLEHFPPETWTPDQKAIIDRHNLLRLVDLLLGAIDASYPGEYREAIQRVIDLIAELNREAK